MHTVGIKEIAKLAGVSPSTVSNAINGNKNISKETREKVLKICEEKNYSPNLMGKNLKTGKNNTILFNFSEFDRGIYLKLVNGINDYLASNGFDLIICTNNSSMKFMKRSFTTGVICADSKMKDEHLMAAANKELPIVVMDRVLDNPYIRSVLLENYHIMCDLVQKIVDKGYSRFGFIGGIDYTLDNKERYRGFLDTLEKNNIKFNVRNYFHGDYREKSGYQAARIMILSNSVPEVVVCANDDMAIGALRAFREEGLEIPLDVAITGFDNSEVAEIAKLTTVDVPLYEGGFLAAKRILGMIQGETAKEVFLFKGSIIWRETV